VPRWHEKRPLVGAFVLVFAGTRSLAALEIPTADKSGSEHLSGRMRVLLSFRSRPASFADPSPARTNSALAPMTGT
jgi:hypothetical protein